MIQREYLSKWKAGIEGLAETKRVFSWDVLRVILMDVALTFFWMSDETILGRGIQTNSKVTGGITTHHLCCDVRLARKLVLHSV